MTFATKSEDHPSSPPDVIYLGISGVLHPSRSTYELIMGRPSGEDGHRDYEYAPLLAGILSNWPDAKIVLTSTQPWKHGLPATIERLGKGLGARVIGFTFEDLTTKIKDGNCQRSMSEMDYWRLDKGIIVEKHVEWLRAKNWIAIDDEGSRWSANDIDEHVVMTRGHVGLNDPDTQSKLVALLIHNFGYPNNEIAVKSGSSSLLTERTERLRGVSDFIFSPDNAHLFTAKAARKAFAHVKLAPQTLALGFEGTLVAWRGERLIPRSYLYSFLESCRELFEEIFLFANHYQEVCGAVEQLRKSKAVPEWLGYIPLLAWDGTHKDLMRTRARHVSDAILIENDAAFVAPGQHTQWIPISTFDGTETGDLELVRVHEELKKFLAEHRGSKKVDQ